MKIIKSSIILIALMLFSCKKEDNDKTFKIYHLKPNNVRANSERLTKNGWYAKSRNDFFVVKNYDINNEQHKIKIDSFVVNYLKKDDFLTANKSVNWSLTFFKYGAGIDENTEHQWGTDYAIHNLFSYKKEIAGFSFNTKVGYSGSKYNVTPEKANKEKSKIISDYFAKTNLSLEDNVSVIPLYLATVSNKTDTIINIDRLHLEKLDLVPGNGVEVSVLHDNTNEFHRMILCTHTKKFDLIDKLYVGKATDFDNGKSHTIEYSLINNNEIVIDKVDWGYVKKDNEEQIDTVKYEKQNISINKSGIISSIKFNK